MKKKTAEYSDKRLGKLKVIPDFLPPPNKLVLKEENVKVTLTLSKSSVDFFKYQAKTYHTQYQKMIKTLLDQYAHRFQ